MGLYNFQKQFVPYVREGSKTHTIRAGRRYPDKPGNTCHLFYGLRTKQSELLLRAPCVRVEEVAICRAQVWVNGEELSLSEKDSLAWRDGFRFPDASLNHKGCFDLMLTFWVEKHGDIDFQGSMIHWDYSRRFL